MSTTAKTSVLPAALPAPFVNALKAGQTLEAAGQFTAAIVAYDHARASAHDASDAPEWRRQRGICWMNRGNALQKIGTSVSVHEAVHAYDQSIVEFAALPPEGWPAGRNHLGAAWLNRGHALIVAGQREAAVLSLENAIAQLEQLPLADDVSFRINLAGAWTNLAHVILVDSPVRAVEAARSALALLNGRESTRPELMEMSLRARRALVMALGEQLMAVEKAGESTAELADEAADAIEAGLNLFRRGEPRGFERFRALGARLFRMGAQLYQLHQPQFLAEFLLEYAECPAFANDAEFASIAREAVASGLKKLQQPQLILAGTPAATRLLDTLQALRDAHSRLHRLPASKPLLS